MKLAALDYEGEEQAAIACSSGYVLIGTINRLGSPEIWSTDVFELVTSGQLERLTQWYNEDGYRALEDMPVVSAEEAKLAPLYRHPRKIWGIGMNYVQDPAELAQVPEGSEPVSFMKPDTALIGPGDSILLPKKSEEVTAEAELAIIIGRTCRNVSEEEAVDSIAGYTASLDMTAADIHAKNQRFLTRAKSFDTFFSLGAELMTPDEAEVLSLTVETWHNGELQHCNQISNMRYRPSYIVAFHSEVMTLLPGDVILTGTPGAVVLRPGDTAECRISCGLLPLVNPVQST